MKALLGTHIYIKALRSWITLLVLLSLSMYSTVNVHTAPAVAQTFAGKSMFVTQPHMSVITSAFAPFLDVIPNVNGTNLFISASGVDQIEGMVVTTITIGEGPTGDQHSYTMALSDTNQAYVTTAVDFSPNTSQSGSITITTSLGLDTGTVNYYRAFVPAATIQTISSVDNTFELALVSPDTIPFDTYIAVTPSFAPPGPVPQDHRLVGSVYTARAAALPTTDKPMILQMYYNDLLLTGADPHTLAVFAWNASSKQWENLEGQLSIAQHSVSVATNRFTTYALMTTTVWRDSFDDSSGLGVTSNVIVRDRMVGLLNLPGNGVAVSQPITLPIANGAWDTLSIIVNAQPPTTTLAVDVLDQDGTTLLTNITGTVNLATIDPVRHPRLKLRANLASAVAGQTPTLDAWQITWRRWPYLLHLPLVVQ